MLANGKKCVYTNRKRKQLTYIERTSEVLVTGTHGDTKQSVHALEEAPQSGQGSLTFVSLSSRSVSSLFCAARPSWSSLTIRMMWFQRNSRIMSNHTWAWWEYGGTVRKNDKWMLWEKKPRQDKERDEERWINYSQEDQLGFRVQKASPVTSHFSFNSFETLEGFKHYLV